jgi:hypothetical protein
MFDFPASPTLNQAYYAPNGPIYIWNGTAWMAQPGSAVANVTYSDTAPPSPFLGQLWLNSSTGILYMWYDDGNSQQWIAISGGAPASVKTARTKNLVTNPCCFVSQENGSATVNTTGAYPADNWQLGFNGTLPQSGIAPVGVIGYSPDGSNTMLNVNAATAKGSLAASDYTVIFQFVEGVDMIPLQWGLPTAKPAVLRFNARADVAGTYGVTLRNMGAYTRTFVATFTITAAGPWQTFVIPVPGDTVGAWVTNMVGSIVINFGYAFGSNYVAPGTGWQNGGFFGTASCINGMAQAGKNLSLTDLGFYYDPDNTGLPPPFQQPEYAEDLARCQRYYLKTFATGRDYGIATANVGGRISFPVDMRAVPSLSYSGISYANASGFATSEVDTKAFGCYATVSATGSIFFQATVAANARM